MDLSVLPGLPFGIVLMCSRDVFSCLERDD